MAHSFGAVMPLYLMKQALYKKKVMTCAITPTSKHTQTVIGNGVGVETAGVSETFGNGEGVECGVGGNSGHVR